MANNSNLSKRAALRQQQDIDDQRKRTRRVLGAGIGLAAVVVVVVLAIVIYQAVASKVDVTATQQTPPNATAGYGILHDGVAPKADVPHMVIWEDYQCPWCKVYEDTYGETFRSLAKDGKITVEIRTATFLDGSKTNGDSYRAAIAAAAADSVGKFAEYHKTVYANQPTEGVGYTNEQLRDTFAKEAGITGDDLTKFQKAYDERAFDEWVKAAANKFTSDGIGSTPTYLVAGKKLELTDASGNMTVAPTTDAFLQAVTAAWEAGGKNNDF